MEKSELSTSRFVLLTFVVRLATHSPLQEVVVGDIALLEPGEIIPVDGIFISGHNVRCDESGATGESDAIKKVPFEQLKGGDGENHTGEPQFVHLSLHTDLPSRLFHT